ncbi:unnamed protein product [Linum tenue]|uniref:Uncharacterized protein n=1 Tax=Linum tenue TaxID=586396 RepID=A0AAV0IX70_9ROSI|nr:unnamed protein product [Linum tenue]
MRNLEFPFHRQHPNLWVIFSSRGISYAVLPPGILRTKEWKSGVLEVYMQCGDILKGSVEELPF